MLTKKEDSFSVTQIDDEYVIMLLDSGEFLSLAGTAGAIWERIDGTRDRDALVADLAREFQAAPEEIASDVDDFLSSLRDAGLIAGG